MKKLNYRRLAVFSLVLSLGVSSLALAEGEGMGEGMGGGPRGGGSFSRPAPVQSAPVSRPVSSRPAAPAPRPAPVYNRPAPAPRPAPVASRPAPAPRPAPIVNRPNPVANRPAPIVNRPSPVTNRPAPVTRNPVANKPPVNNRPVPVVNNGGTHTNPPPVRVNPPGKTPGPVNNRPAPVVTHPVQPQPGKIGNRGGNVDPNRGPKPGQKLTPPPKVVQHKGPIELDNQRSVNNIRIANIRVNVYRNNTKIVNVVNEHTRVFQERYYRDYRDLGDRYGRFHNDYGYRNYYHGYWRWGFYGGFFYPFRPCYDIATYFYYPTLYWLFVETVDAAYYEPYYGGVVVEPFPFVQVYYPTETLVDLGVEVAAYPEKHSNYRLAMRKLTEGLAQQLANNMNETVQLAKGDVVITHYQNLENVAYAMDGYVHDDALGIKVGFRAYVDLNDPEQTLVYVPSSDQPTAADEYTLGLINQRIQALGGDPYAADVSASSSVQDF